MSPRPDRPRPDARRPRPGSSRAATSRPRRLAGTRGTEPTEPTEPTELTDSTEPTEPTEPAGARESTGSDRSGPRTRPPATDRVGLLDALGGRRGRRALVAVVAVLTAVVLAEGLYLWRSAEEPVRASGDRPVAVPEQRWRPAVEAAAQGAEIILGAGWQDYDEGIERARAVMTDEFAETFLATKEDVREEFVADRTEVEVRVLGQAVTRATVSTVSALVFFDQYVTKEGSQTSFSQYRALVTVVDTADGWLVDRIDTR